MLIVIMLNVVTSSRPAEVIVCKITLKPLAYKKLGELTTKKYIILGLLDITPL